MDMSLIVARMDAIQGAIDKREVNPATGNEIDLPQWAQDVCSKFPQVLHVYLFGSKVHGHKVKNDTDVFLMLADMPESERRALAVGLYGDSALMFADLDLFLNFPDDVGNLFNWQTGGKMFTDTTKNWKLGSDYISLWEQGQVN